MAFTFSALLSSSNSPNYFSALHTLSGHRFSGIPKVFRQNGQSKLYLSSFGPTSGFQPTRASSFYLIPFFGSQKGKHFFIEFFVLLSFSSKPLFAIFLNYFSTSFVFKALFFAFLSLFLPKFCPQAPFRNASHSKI